MAARRHLPVISSAPAPAAAAEGNQDPPPWHWIPLGSVVSLVALVPLAPVMLAVMRGALRLGYPEGLDATALASLRRAAGARVIAAELLASAVPVLTVVLCVALGGYVVGRRGERTNHRHAVLSGACTALLCAALSRSVVAALVLVPLSMLAGGISGRVGVRRRERSAQDQP